MHALRIVCIAITVMLVACSDPAPPTPRTDVSATPHRKPSGNGEFPAELARYRDAVEKSKLNYIGIKSRRANDTEPSTSKYRGKAYWPKGADYPLDPRGQPLLLLAQINFSEAPALEDFPNEGILQFFIAGDVTKEQVWGMLDYDEKPFNPRRWFASLQDQRYFRVVYHAKPSAESPQLGKPPSPNYQYVMPVMDEAQLSFEKKSEYVLLDDYKFEKVFGRKAYDLFATFGAKERDVANRYIDFAHESVPAKIGGYASFVQQDPRESAADDDWLLLLEMHSTGQPDSVDVLWGDAGTGGFFIRRADLVKRDFSKVAYYWDNY